VIPQSEELIGIFIVKWNKLCTCGLGLPSSPLVPFSSLSFWFVVVYYAAERRRPKQRLSSRKDYCNKI
jgi:hypothetical protein